MSSTLTIFWHRNRGVLYIVPAVVFIIVAAILDKIYLSPDIQITVIVGLIVGVFALLIAGVFIQPYLARGDNYVSGHVPQRDEPVDIPFHGGRIIETPLNYNPDNDFEEDRGISFELLGNHRTGIANGEFIPRHDMPLYMTEPKDFRDLFPELDDLGVSEVWTIHLQYDRHFRDRFDLYTGAIVAKRGVPFYHPHADEANLLPTVTNYYDEPGEGAKPYPVFEVILTRKGDFEMYSSIAWQEGGLPAYVRSIALKNKEEKEAPDVLAREEPSAVPRAAPSIPAASSEKRDPQGPGTGKEGPRREKKP
jgi:hypothetical protein